MDDLISQVQEKTGLSKDKVIEVVTIVTDFMKDLLPEDLVETVSEYLGGAGEMSASVAGSAADMATGAARSATSVASGATEKVVGTASVAFSKATDTISGVVKSSDDEA